MTNVPWENADTLPEVLGSVRCICDGALVAVHALPEDQLRPQLRYLGLCSLEHVCLIRRRVWVHPRGDVIACTSVQTAEEAP